MRCRSSFSSSSPSSLGLFGGAFAPVQAAPAGGRSIDPLGVVEATAEKVAVDAAVPEGLATEDWASIRAAYEAGRHQVCIAERGHEARNPGQRWTTRFDGRGFCTTPDAGR
jgi:hypothetical protein